MSEPYRFSMLIQWSEEDQAYLVTFPEWTEHVTTPTTHGNSYEEAVQNGHEVLAALVDLAHQQGWELPQLHVYAATA